MFMFVRSGPMPGCVMMSMNRPPAKWFSAANASRVMWIALIADFGGSRPPSKLSTRMTALPPAMSCSCCAISSGSSDSASICSRVIAVPNVDAPIRRRLARVARHRHRILQPLDGEHGDVLVVARLQLHVLQDARLEAGELRLDGVAAGREAGHDRDALVVRS